SDAKYVPTATLPNYGDMVKVVERVKPLEEQVRLVPAILTLEHLESQPESAPQAELEFNAQTQEAEPAEGPD
ncbi:MAG: hypothetical protein AAFO06_24295, partial [Cyanobacteria bacterium J06597_16]